jgi:hypothetical protein
MVLLPISGIMECIFRFALFQIDDDEAAFAGLRAVANDD